MAKIPTNYADRAQLGMKVARNWQNNFPSYTTKFTTFADLLQLSQNLADEASKSKQAQGKKRVNTVKLQTLNKTIDDSLAKLKSNIQHATDTTDSTYFGMYGIQKIRTTYMFPRDNDSRIEALEQLVAKLREPNDIVAQEAQGLAFWESLAAQHKAEWEQGGDINSDKSTASGGAKNYFKDCGNLLTKLQAQIRIDFNASQLPTVLRAFGFQQESY